MAGSKFVTTKKGVTMTLYNYKGGLYINFVLDGKRKRKSLKMRDTKQNRQIANKEIIPALQKKILLGEYGDKKEEVKTFKYYADFFLKEKESKIDTFQTKLVTYNKVINHFGNMLITNVNRFEIKQYLNSLKIKPVSKKLYLSTIKEVLELAIDDNAITSNDAIGIRIGKHEQPKIDYFTKDEITDILSNAVSWYKTYLEIAFSTGMRHEEIIALKFSDIHNGFVKIQRVKTKKEIKNKTKTDCGRRTIPFSVNIEHLKENSFYLFPHINDVSYFKKSWRTLLKKSKVRYRSIKNTRHTFATHLLKDELVSMNELAGLLGHAKVSTTFTYYASVIDSHDVGLSEKLKRQSFVKLAKSS